MPWKVQLVGDEFDLAALAQSLNGGEIAITREGQEYALSSDRFLENDEGRTVLSKAEEIVVIISGACRLSIDARRSITVGAVYRVDEAARRHIFMFPEPGVLELRGGLVGFRVDHEDGTSEEVHPADPVKDWLYIALGNETVRKVFRILAGGPLDWVNLYRVLELVAHDVGDIKSVSKNGWASASALDIFKHTSNNPLATGLDAQHGASKEQPPKRPMPLSEARALIFTMTQAWLRSKITKN